jgi:SAM-dependent methyltransferase
MSFDLRNTCRSCNSSNIKTILAYGHMPLANSLVKPDETGDEETYPLTLAFCTKCSLVQILETVDPNKLFKDYAYFSSVSDAWLKHARDLAHDTIKRFDLDKKSLVIEAASNDGYLLKNYKEWGIPVLGIDPAENIAAAANNNGILTMPEFFNTELASQLKGKGQQCDVFHANNVLAHVDPTNDFVEAISIVLKPDGVAICEFPYIANMIEHLEFDTVYHEHLCYFSLQSVSHLFDRHGLTIVDAELIPTHGGSLRIYAKHFNPDGQPETQRLRILETAESKRKMDKWEYYSNFARDVNKLGITLWKTLAELKANGKKICAYGASAKGNTLLNYFGIDGRIIEYIVDKSPHKQNLYAPGVLIPVVGPIHMNDTRLMCEYALLLTWNFKDEIISQNKLFLSNNGKFIVPLPDFCILNEDDVFDD